MVRRKCGNQGDLGPLPPAAEPQPDLSDARCYAMCTAVSSAIASPSGAGSGVSCASSLRSSRTSGWSGMTRFEREQARGVVVKASQARRITAAHRSGQLLPVVADFGDLVGGEEDRRRFAASGGPLAERGLALGGRRGSRVARLPRPPAPRPQGQNAVRDRRGVAAVRSSVSCKSPAATSASGAPEAWSSSATSRGCSMNAAPSLSRVCPPVRVAGVLPSRLGQW